MNAKPTERTPQAVAEAARLGTIVPSFAPPDEPGYITHGLEAIIAAVEGSAARARQHARTAARLYRSSQELAQ